MGKSWPVKKLLLLAFFYCLLTTVHSQKVYKEIATISETKCDSYFPICFLKEGNEYNVLRNKEHWYWRNYNTDTEDVGKMMDEIIQNMNSIIDETDKKQVTQTRLLLKDQAENIKMYINYFYDKIDFKNKRRHRSF